MIDVFSVLLNFRPQYCNDEWIGPAPLKMSGQFISFISVQFVAKQQDSAAANAIRIELLCRPSGSG
jgi:hypothetical protein